VALAVASCVAAEASLGYGGAIHPYGGSSYTFRSVQGLTGGHYGHYLGKREAGYSTGLALHPTGTSYSNRSPQGLRALYAPAALYHHGLGKRSASYYGPGLAFHGYGATSYEARSPQGLQVHRGYYHGLGKRSAEPGYYGPARAFHSYGGSSYEARSPQGLRAYGYHHGIGKRSAEPGYFGGYYAAPSSAASVRVSVAEPYSHANYNYGYDIHHLGKRSAEPGYFGGYYGSGRSHVSESRPLFSYGYGIHHAGKRSAEPSYLAPVHYYGSGSSYQAVSRPLSHYGVNVHHG